MLIGSAPIEDARAAANTIAAHFERQVAATPSNFAIVTDDVSLTYRDLDLLAGNIAARVAAENSAPDGPIAILLEKGPFAIAAMLGATKAGRIFVPLELSAPEAWLTGVVGECGAAQILTDTKWLAVATRIGQGVIVHNVQRFEKETPLRSLPVPEGAAAVIIYTSGSTGHPKGVVISQRGFLHGLELRSEALRINDNDRFALLRPMAYSAGLKDVFMVLFSGACLFPYDLPAKGLTGLFSWLSERNITGFSSTSSLFRTWLASLESDCRFATLRKISAQAEPLYGQDILRAAQHLTGDWRIVHGLSSTETGVIANRVYGPSSQIKEGILPVGSVVRATDVQIIKEDGTLARTGESGEIFVKSRFLALGYWKDPAATTAAFSTDPADPDQRMFRSGDLGRWCADGSLEHLGRTNRKTKLRGFSVDPYEIEAALLKGPFVRDAAVIVVGEGSYARLLAYVVGPPDDGAATVRGMIAARLPPHMVPSQITILDCLPITSRGKVDRKALETLALPVKSGATVPPFNQTERSILRIWRRYLDIPEIGVTDDFFEIGGTSLQGFLIFVAIAQTFGDDLPPTTMMEAPTIAKQAKLLEGRGSRRKSSKLIAFRDSGSQPPLFLIHAMFGDIAYGRELAQHLSSDRPVFGLRPFTLDGTEPIRRTMETIASDYIYEIRKVQPTGPYAIAGHSFGGRIAFAMAQQLLRSGEVVNFLGLIDTYAQPKRREMTAPRLRRHVNELREHSIKDAANYIVKRAARNFFHGIAVARLAALEYVPNISSRFIQPPSYASRRDLYRTIFRRALSRYKSQPYNGHIVVFSAKGMTHFHKTHWEPLAVGGLTVTEIPGGHVEMVRPPYSILLAQALDACFNASNQ
jgi:amino acid adenylation domain-containing protein